MKKIYNIKGMTCGGCVASVTKKLQEIEGVVSAAVSLKSSERVPLPLAVSPPASFLGISNAV